MYMYVCVRSFAFIIREYIMLMNLLTNERLVRVVISANHNIKQNAHRFREVE